MNVRLSDYAYRYPRRSALLVGLLGGVVSVAVDIDHIFAPRAWHIPLLIGVVLVAIYCLARIRRYTCKDVLKESN